MRLHARDALLPEGWARDVQIEVDHAGFITSVSANAPQAADAERLDGFVIPGIANVHSHAFQRAMAGFTEARTHPTDTFWTWRALMYAFAAKITPDQMQDIASHVYIEMLKAGYTGVAEFHYMHRDSSGKAYADPAEMSHRMIAAAQATGIAIAHLPVLYRYGGFGGTPPEPGQERFVQSNREFAALMEALHARYRFAAGVRIGAAFHSLRAVDAQAMREALAALDGLDRTSPIHIHIAEQTREVADCLAWSGRRPVDWLLDNAPVDERWCLVHATQLDAGEVARLAASGAVAGICPSTEANLGDGFFPAIDYLGAATPGRIAIGGDSHAEVSVAEELKILEYGQRLISHRRAALASEAEPSPGQRMFVAAASGGAQCLGMKGGRIEGGFRADLVVLDPEHAALWNKQASQALDAWIFAGDSRCVRDVMVGGAWRIRGGRHAGEAEAAQRFRATQAALID